MQKVTTFCASLLAALSNPAFAAPAKPVSSADSFRVGDAGVLCSAQNRSGDVRFGSMFDRGYDVVCRDAVTPVGQIYALKANRSDVATRFLTERDKGIDCTVTTEVTLGDLKGVSKSDCRVVATGLNYTVYTVRRGNDFFAAEGLAAYDSALTLGLLSLVADRQVPGEITVATTNAGDPAAFARVQAATLDPGKALASGYAKSVEGSYAEAAEFFESLAGRARTGEAGANRPALYLANSAIQQSNVGNYAEADRLFSEADKAPSGGDPMFGRHLRNLKAMHLLNRGKSSEALNLLNRPVPEFPEMAEMGKELLQGAIGKRLAERLAAEDNSATKLGESASPLTDAELAALLDAQARFLRGVALRGTGDKVASRKELEGSLADYGAVRGGRIAGLSWLAADAANELAMEAQAEGDLAQAESYLRKSLTVFEAAYPGSARLIAARAKLAGLQAKRGDTATSIATFRDLVRQAATVPGGSDALRPLIQPYFDALTSETSGQAPADFFLASQAMVRPGVAQTQAVFARELSGGSGEASDLFRQSVNLTREVVSVDVEVARLSAIESRTNAESEALIAAQAHRKEIAVAQTTLLAKLAAFPKFRVMSNATLELANLQSELKPDEAYYKLLLVGEAAYGLMARQDGAKIMKLPATRKQLEKLTNTIRDSIVIEESNQLTTNPFDLAASRKMFLTLFGEVADQMPSIKHLIFEPDGPLLKLPANVLVTEQASVDAYKKRQKAKNPDEFDFSGVAWLGKDRMVSTAVSAQSFLDIRKLPPSKAQRRYLGVGQNTPSAKLAYAPKSEAGRDPCDWGLSLWDKPISGSELQLASKMLGGTGNEVITEEGYSDTALRERHDLNNFRIIQFATHGLVTAPHPGCPARPALVTSFGPKASDGLLSFKEIFDLKLDADTIILSACDTAGAATASATREAGITTGGNFALDGLVRAFVGAGARSVIASHWPVPDDYHATSRLMGGIYEGGTHQSVGESMRLSQNKLMADPLTSHPYYWAAFAIVGDANKPLTTDNTAGQFAVSDISTSQQGIAK